MDTLTTRFVCRPAADEADGVGGMMRAWFDAERHKVILLDDGKDPNTYVRHDSMHLLFTDQAEYYAVCPNCYATWRGEQWSGSTRVSGWQDASREYLLAHIKTKGWCEFCDPVFGNGGWI